LIWESELLFLTAMTLVDDRFFAGMSAILRTPDGWSRRKAVIADRDFGPRRESSARDVAFISNSPRSRADERDRPKMIVCNDSLDA
jgi:hypothetical protein